MSFHRDAAHGKSTKAVYTLKLIIQVEQHKNTQTRKKKTTKRHEMQTGKFPLVEKILFLAIAEK